MQVGKVFRIVMLATPVSAQEQPKNSADGLAGTAWNAVELVGTPVPSQPGWENPPHLVFGTDGHLSGANGCNLLSGPYTVKGEAISFSNLAVTQMACVGIADETERRFQGALNGTAHWRIENGRLNFYGATGKPLAVFERRSEKTSGGDVLQGTRWQLVKFQSMDDTTLKPDDPTRYTIEFQKDGHVVAQIDCNRGIGMWTATSSSQIELSPLALTRAQCPEGSMHDQIARQWPNITSFVIRDGHLFLALKIDSGIYEFAPLPAGK